MEEVTKDLLTEMYNEVNGAGGKYLTPAEIEKSVEEILSKKRSHNSAKSPEVK